jgi:DNA-binding NtrC family response regulator
MSLTDKRILIVEDDQGLRENISQILKTEFSTVLTAEDGLQAYQLLKTTQVDIMFSDIKMPHLDGIGMIRKLLADGIHVPTVLASGAADREDMIVALKLGVLDFVEKPYRSDAVKQALHRTFELLAREQELIQLGQTGDAVKIAQKQKMIGLLYAVNGRKIA